MKLYSSLLFCVFLLLHGDFAQAQRNITPGYIIMSNGDTVNGYLDYQNWRRIPKNISFRDQPNSAFISYGLNEIIGFGVKERHYRRAIVLSEISSDIITDLKDNADPNLITDTCFLECLVMGDKSLYVYVNKIGKEQFYIFNNGVFEWLGYHRFLQNHDFAEGITVNKVYQEQLDIYLKDCRSLHDRIYRTPYLRKPLLHVFQAYYQCRRKKPVYISSPEKIEFQLMVTAGINRSRIYFDGNYYDYIVKGKYPMSTSPSLGIGLDVIVPKNRKRLSIYNQLEYFTLLAKDEQQTANQTQIGIHSLSLCHSLRYRPYQSKHLSVFVQAGICNAYNKLFRNQTLGAYPQGIEKKALAEIRPLETGYVFGLGGKFYRMGCLLFMQHGNGISTYTALTSYTRRYGLSFSFQLL